MITESERLDRNERQNSLAAFLRAIKFRKAQPKDVANEPQMARLHSRVPPSAGMNDDQNCIRSAN